MGLRQNDFGARERDLPVHRPRQCDLHQGQDALAEPFGGRSQAGIALLERQHALPQVRRSEPMKRDARDQPPLPQLQRVEHALIQELVDS